MTNCMYFHSSLFSHRQKCNLNDDINKSHFFSFLTSSTSVFRCIFMLLALIHFTHTLLSLYSLANVAARHECITVKGKTVRNT